MTVGAERVENAPDPSAGAVDQGYVALIGRGVAEVAARGHDDVGTVDVQGRAELLVRGIAGDAHRPGAAPRSSAPSASESLWISPLGEAAYTNSPFGSAKGLAVVICADARPICVAGWGERPQDAAARGVDRERSAIRGRDDDRLVVGAVDECRVQVDRRGVNGPRERHAQPVQMPHIGARDLSRAFGRVCRVAGSGRTPATASGAWRPRAPGAGIAAVAPIAAVELSAALPVLPPQAAISVQADPTDTRRVRWRVRMRLF